MWKNKLEKRYPSEEGRIARRTQIVNRTHIQGIVPPHILREIAKKGDPEQRKLALNSLMASEKVRGMREAFAELFVATPVTPVDIKCNKIYDAKHLSHYDLPGDQIEDPGNSNDEAAKEAFDGAEATYNFYKDIYERNSIDDKGMCLISSVHFQENYDNALWNGRQMIYGDGDGKIFERFTISIDVIGHELTHGVTEFEAGLVYSNQPGALNESMSDVGGILVKQHKLNQTAEEADWLIGKGLFTSNIEGQALRSMKEPGTAYDDKLIGKDPQPGHMKNFKKLPNTEEGDYGGVHINSGIPNRAFYLTAIEIGGYAWEKAGKIWYTALRDMLRPKSNFKDAAKKTYLAAGILFGEGSEEQQAVKKGWDGVGIAIK